MSVKLLGIPNSYLCARGSSLVQDLLGVAFGELVLEERAQTGDITFNTLRFEPAMVNGKPVVSLFQQPYRFGGPSPIVRRRP